MKIQLAANGRCIAIGIDAMPWPYTAPGFITPDNYNRWVCSNTNDILNSASWTESEPPVNPLSPIDIVNKDLRFGLDFRLKVIELIKTQNMTNADRLSLMNKIKDAMNSLDYGDIVVSRAVFNSIATDVTLYTTARKTWVLQQLDNYLAS